MKKYIIDDLLSWGSNNYVKHESMIFWLINKICKWSPRPIYLGVVLSSLLPHRSFDFLFKSECCLSLCHYQFNCICNLSWTLFVVYNYKYLKITSRHQISWRGLNHNLCFLILKSWCGQICHWVSLIISKSLYILHLRLKYCGRDQFCIMVELVHPLFVSILKGKVSKSPFIDNIVVNTFDMIQQCFSHYVYIYISPENHVETWSHEKTSFVFPLYIQGLI